MSNTGRAKADESDQRRREQTTEDARDAEVEAEVDTSDDDS